MPAAPTAARPGAPPLVIDQPEPGTERIASWSSLVVVPHSGRVYCIYHKNTGVVDYDPGMTGVLAWRVSDDGGTTWSERFQTPIGRGAIDHPDETYPSNWVTAGWQLPIVTGRGQVICPITRWSSRRRHQRDAFGHQHHEAWFLRFENILTESDPSRLVVTTLPRGDRGIRIPHPHLEDSSAAMEPCIQSLADGRILCLLRTMTGSLYYCLSEDCGETWSTPEELCFAPGGPPILHPNAPCALGSLADGRFVLLFHNNDGTANGGTGPADNRGRRPVWLCVGRELENPGGQPLEFEEPQQLYDNGGPARPYAGSLALYGTFFENAGCATGGIPTLCASCSAGSFLLNCCSEKAFALYASPVAALSAELTGPSTSGSIHGARRSSAGRKRLRYLAAMVLVPARSPAMPERVSSGNTGID